MTVHCPIKEEQPDGMSHRGGGGLYCQALFVATFLFELLVKVL